MQLQVIRNEIHLVQETVSIKMYYRHFTAGGPVGAAAAGVLGGAAFDGVVTAAESAKNNKYSPQGMII